MPDALQKWKNAEQLDTRLLAPLWKFLPTAFHSCLVFVLEHEPFYLSILILIIEIDMVLNTLVVYALWHLSFCFLKTNYILGVKDIVPQLSKKLCFPGHALKNSISENSSRGRIGI